jgi:hypothetical protein
MTDAVSTQTGLSIKVLGVEGEMLPSHAGVLHLPRQDA